MLSASPSPVWFVRCADYGAAPASALERLLAEGGLLAADAVRGKRVLVKPNLLTDRTPDDLRAIGVSQQAMEALMLLTHDAAVPYLDYVRNLKDNPIARKVKLADLHHNSQISRLDTVTERDLARLEKYTEARAILGDTSPASA